MGFAIVGLIVFALGFFIHCAITDFKEKRLHKEYLSLYRGWGGRPYEQPRFVKNKADWEAQNTTNCRAREFAKAEMKRRHPKLSPSWTTSA